jgi:sugar phosphate isomerase/epimerase
VGASGGGSALIRPGICSVTLRRAGTDEVIEVAARAGLAAIEWGADTHVPPGDVRRAEEVRRATEQAGLAVASYGSYFLRRPDGDPEFAPVLASAQALGAPRIRIWAGWSGGTGATAAHRDALLRAVRAAAGQAERTGVELAFEFHGGTLTDTADGTMALLADLGGTGVRTYWQPPVRMADDEALAGLDLIVDQVSAVHVFSWWPERERLPLDARAELWRRVFGRLRAQRRPFDALLEFVPGDDPAAVVRDAAVLRGLLADG